MIEWTILTFIFFLTSMVSTVTGSTSLITVPVLFHFGIEPRTALATNMLALTFMSVGGTLPFIGKSVIDRTRLPLLIVLTLVSSFAGALLVFLVPSNAIPPIISLAMIVVAVFSMVQPQAGIAPVTGARSYAAESAGYAATFALGIYGGFFSGGYVTLLTAAYTALFRMTFVEAVSTTKLINIFSSLVATLLFLSRGLIDYRLGIILYFPLNFSAQIASEAGCKPPVTRFVRTCNVSRGAPKSLRNGGQSPNFTCYEQITNHFGVPHLAESRVILSVAMFLGASMGGCIVLKMSNVWLRRVFLTAVVILALKILLYDVLRKMLLLTN